MPADSNSCGKRCVSVSPLQLGNSCVDHAGSAWIRALPSRGPTPWRNPSEGPCQPPGLPPAREGGSNSDYPILQGCTDSGIQGPPHYAMLTLRREAKNSLPPTPSSIHRHGVCPLLSPTAFLQRFPGPGGGYGQTHLPGVQGAPFPQHQGCQGRQRASLQGQPPPGEDAGAHGLSENPRLCYQSQGRIRAGRALGKPKGLPSSPAHLGSPALGSSESRAHDANRLGSGHSARGPSPY